ncbi:MAG TPA: ACT domain-containing protein [Candidatus Diapherotrites archaeon]|uniref:ACT domain-containing protein n=1 Tax=Candidatus Iainarchaeum sp. TaxID=3101447 RepID=A0A7J4JFR8_9ARCH|nr:ACT domain-containing protein [Candidatus Diapherotrites archaeon]HIH16621.1 ACT domain-containing protein [Candidatus Diapherotrites archaeon]
MSLAKTVEAYVGSRPFIRAALKEGLLNQSALARRVIEDEKLRKTDFDAVLVGLRRFAESAKPAKSLEHRILGLLRGSRLRVVNRMCTFVLSNRVSLRELNKLIGSIMERDETIHLFHGSHTFTVVTQDSNHALFVKHFKPFVVLERTGLAEITIESGPEIEQIPGVMAFFYSLLAERGININETLSSYTDTILVVAEKDVQKAMEALRV